MTLRIGDNLYTTTYEAVWSSWRRRGFDFPIVAIGNHNDGYVAEERFFEMPGEFYSKQVSNLVRFVVLNSDNTASASQQASFLDSELTQAQEPFVFIVYHHPTYSLSHRHEWQEKRAFQLAVRPVLQRHRSKITALLVGHDHLAMIAHFDDLPLIVAGAIWETRADTPVNDVQDGVRVSTNWFYNGEPQWAKLEIDRQSHRAIVTFVRSSDDAITCVARIATGSRAEMGTECR